ncbi:MAG: glutamate-cysteine ligase family protein [Candidatus Helarchaeota archaeon]
MVKEKKIEWQFNEKNGIKLPFTHGMECEIALLDGEGQLPSGDSMLYLFKKIIEEALVELQNRVQLDDCPKLIKNKLVGLPYQDYNEEKGDVIKQKYKLPDNSVVDIEIFGRDGNVAAITYILECVTPPAEYLDELIWWLKTLISVGNEVCVRNNLFLCSTGLPPLIPEYLRGLTYSDHHHIGSFKDEAEKKRVYNMFRAFIPHIIALTANSPFIKGAPTDEIKTIGKDPKKLRYAAPGCVRSIRLKNNTSMLSQNDPKVYIPHLTADKGADYFCQVIQKASIEDAKFQDIFPYSDWKTIEFRVCDAPITINKRIGMVLLLQALALKARNMEIPDVGSKSIVINRSSAIQRGMFASFKTDQILDLSSNKEFQETYIGGDNPIKYMYLGIQNLLKFCIEPWKKMGVIDKKMYKDFGKNNYLGPFLSPLFISVFGELKLADIPFQEAEFQLLLYSALKEKTPYPGPQLLSRLIKYSFQGTNNPYFSVITGEFNTKAQKWFKI